MTRTTINELKNRRLDAMTPEQRAAFDQTYDATRLALEVGEKVRDAREAAGLNQRDGGTRATQADPAWKGLLPATRPKVASSVT